MVLGIGFFLARASPSVMAPMPFARAIPSSASVMRRPLSSVGRVEIPSTGALRPSMRRPSAAISAIVARLPRSLYVPPSSIMPPRAFFIGIFAPALRASLMAMATACFGFLTSGPFFEPLCNLPDANSPITLAIFCSPLTLPPLAYLATRAGLFIGPSPPGMSARLTVMPPLANLRPEVVS